MEAINARLAGLGIKIPDIILPAKNVDVQKWSVIACDQWTQSHDYWKAVADFVGDSPSTLNLIYPEVYLEYADRQQRIANIHKTMKAYLDGSEGENNILSVPHSAGSFLERETKNGVRRGLVVAIDLEQYDWRKNETLIRATEGTIQDRLPPRMEIRRSAPLELPHIMLLLDDDEDVLMSLLEKVLKNAPYVYDSPLMMNGGHVKGRLLYRKNDWSFIADTFDLLLRKSNSNYKTTDGFLFAVGDGNHSLATAKAVWDEYKAAHSGDPCIMNHNARYALAEIVNLYDKSLMFEPIHRVLFNIKFDAVLNGLKGLKGFTSREFSGFAELKCLVCEDNVPKNRCGIVCGTKFVLAEFDAKPIAAVQMEKVLDDLIAKNNKAAHSGETAIIDYIHGADEVLRLSSTAGGSGEPQVRSEGGSTPLQTVGILMPPFLKNKLFESVKESGALPRKTFSIGEANEKRFYLETRKIF
ncbi:MAG: DUF1015 domain-containing protein [Termitinemataceae bacterium]|nr:MAG: DUF1015 domain-containing protein [Termitinemataceae bacterium]